MGMTESAYFSAYEAACRQAERLAAYEETGLTPGDIKDLQGLCKENGLAEYVDLIVEAKRLIAQENERSIERDERIEQLEAQLNDRHDGTEVGG